MKADREKPSYSILSFVLMTASVLGLVAFLIHTLLQRRRFNKAFLKLEVREDLPALTSFFMDTPAAFYVAMFAVVVAVLLVKEIAIERKSVALRINAAMLVGLAALWATWVMAMPVTLERMHEAAP